METVNVLNQMAEYDFNAPIDVEMIFEDSEDDDSSTQNGLSEPEIIDDNTDKQVSVQKCRTECVHKKSSEINRKAKLCLNKNNRILKEKPIEEISENDTDNHLNTSNNVEIRSNISDVEHYLNQSQFDANKHASIIIDNVAGNNEDSLPSTCVQVKDQHELINTFVQDLLNKLSEHIVLIMQSFYHYGVRNSTQDNKKREEIFNFIKSHFFEISYSTVESIILPKENNDSFINQFLDSTVLIANKKSLRWKCHRGHVQPFFKELVTWTKHRREKIKRNHLLCSSNENITLKQQLIRPLLPLVPPQSKNFENRNVATPKTQNNLCIYTSGTPGQEISINIDANTLIHIAENQQYVTAERNGNNNNYAPSNESTRKNTPAARPIYGNCIHDTQKNYPHNRRPPPPYNINHCSKMSHRPQQYNKTNMNLIRTNHGHMGLYHQNHQNMGPPTYNYQTQMQYVNSRQMSPTYNDSLNYLLYDNPYNNNNPLQHETQIEHQVTSSPVITNVSSLDSSTHILNIRCYMCGKNTSTPYSPHNPPYRQAYCSFLCKELDSQFYKPA